MRGAVWAVLLLLLPVASGLTMTPPTENHVSRNGEHLLVLEEGVWTSAKWKMLEDGGIQPLRSIRADALLVWTENDRDSWPLNVEVGASQSAHLRLGLDTPAGPNDYRVLLEPRLPEDGIEKVRSAVDRIGLSIASSSLDVRGNLPGSLTVHAPSVQALEPLLRTDGVLWIEPVLTTHARNGQASALIESGSLDEHPYWSMGLNGSGVVIGVADSGLDADHDCFRNATTGTSEHAEAGAPFPAVGVFGSDHRKILHMNTSVDGNDTPGHSDYRHGTHVIGSLACHDIGSYRQGTKPSSGSTLAHGSTLVVQDIVSNNGWEPPNVDVLLWESSSYGGVVHSNSWGDSTTEYTERTARFDAYARVMPWSLALIAPGNSGEGVLEPANGRNVVAVGATTKSLEDGRWGSSSYGPTEAGTDGIFVLAPGGSIQSAGADGFWNTNNANLRSSSGTSMSTPHASGATAVIQQLYEDGWLIPAFAPITSHSLNELKPPWAASAPLNASIQLGEGFTPSGSLLRASLAMAASPLPDEVRNGGEEGYELHNPYDGWGALNLSRLFDPTSIHGLGESPTNDTWIHDSYRLTSGSVGEWFEVNKGESGDLSGMVDTGAPLDGAIGPFLQTGDVFSQRLALIDGEDVRIRMAFPAQPEPAMVDDLQLRVRLEDGTILLPDHHREGDGSPTQFYPHIVDTNNTTAFPSSNETVVGLDIPHGYLSNASYLDIDVIARFVQPGGEEGTTGLDGDAVGFALVVKGVQRDSSDYVDNDGDGVLNIDDACLWSPAPAQYDVDRDGCLDDDDDDGVPNRDDVCPGEFASLEVDLDRDGCVDTVPEEWKILIDFNEGCAGCAIDLHSALVKVDGVNVHAATWDDALSIGLDETPYWEHVLNQHPSFDVETFEEIELEIKLNFAYHQPSTSGRQFGSWPNNWDIIPSYNIPLSYWDVDIELKNDVAFHQEHVATMSRYYMYSSTQTHTHVFTWSKQPVHDHDGDGYGVPGLDYHGYCWDESIDGHEDEHDGYGYSQHNDCTVMRYNVNDEYPADGTQWADTDGDGYGDNASGYLGDIFPNDPSEWSDEDADGFGDNSDGCPQRVGVSAAVGCPDSDGDGFPDIIDDYGRAWGYNGEIYDCNYEWWGCVPSPTGEGPSMAVDGDPATKYLNRGKYNTGIIITPRAASTVASIEFVSANDEWARDPTSFHLYGTNDAVTSDANSRGDEENWVVIGTGEIDLPYERYSPAAIVYLDNAVAYRSYKLIFPTVKGDYDAMQIAEIQFFTSSEEPIFSGGDPVIGVHDAPSYSLMLNAGDGPYYRQPTARTDMCPHVPGEAYLGGGAGCPDADRDGWADPVNDRPFIEADMCPNNAGEATTPTGRGCPDADRDGWADFEDDLPYDSDYHLDSDGDGYPDEEDAFPHNAFLQHQDQVVGFLCFGVIGGVVFALFIRRKTEEPPLPVTIAPEAIVVGQLEEGNSFTDNDTFW